MGRLPGPAPLQVPRHLHPHAVLLPPDPHTQGGVTDTREQRTDPGLDFQPHSPEALRQDCHLRVFRWNSIWTLRSVITIPMQGSWSSPEGEADGRLHEGEVRASCAHGVSRT